MDQKKFSITKNDWVKKNFASNFFLVQKMPVKKMLYEIENIGYKINFGKNFWVKNWIKKIVMVQENVLPQIHMDPINSMGPKM